LKVQGLFGFKFLIIFEGLLAAYNNQHSYAARLQSFFAPKAGKKKDFRLSVRSPSALAFQLNNTL
jgi:hypothetical protein